MVMLCFCEVEEKSTATRIDSYLEILLLAKKHSPTTDLHIDDEKKCHNELGRKEIDPLDIGPLEPPLGRSN